MRICARLEGDGRRNIRVSKGEFGMKLRNEKNPKEFFEYVRSKENIKETTGPLSKKKKRHLK